MFIQRNRRSPHFTMEELTQIMRRAERRDTRSMQETARILYPGRDEAAYEGLYLSRGPGRAVKNADGKYEAFMCNLVSWPAGVGMLRDGSIHSF